MKNLHMFSVGTDGNYTTLWVSLHHRGARGTQVQMSSPYGAFSHYWDGPGDGSLSWLLDVDHERKFINSAVRGGAAASKAARAVRNALKAWPALVEEMKKAIGAKPAAELAGPDLYGVSNVGGDHSYFCAGCDREQDETHSYAECIEVLRLEREAWNSQAHDPKWCRHLLSIVDGHDADAEKMNAQAAAAAKETSP